MAVPTLNRGPICLTPSAICLRRSYLPIEILVVDQSEKKTLYSKSCFLNIPT